MRQLPVSSPLGRWSRSSRMTKECGNSVRLPLKLNRKVWLSLRRSLEKLFLRGGGARPRSCSPVSGDILRSARSATLSASSAASSLILTRRSSNTGADRWSAAQLRLWQLHSTAYCTRAQVFQNSSATDVSVTRLSPATRSPPGHGHARRLTSQLIDRVPTF